MSHGSKGYFSLADKGRMPDKGRQQDKEILADKWNLAYKGRWANKKKEKKEEDILCQLVHSEDFL